MIANPAGYSLFMGGLPSDESRYVTGTTMVIDAGAAQPFKIPHAG